MASRVRKSVLIKLIFVKSNFLDLADILYLAKFFDFSAFGKVLAILGALPTILLPIPNGLGIVTLVLVVLSIKISKATILLKLLIK